MFEVTLKALEAGVASFQPQTVDVPGILVTADNVEKFVADHAEALQ